MKEFIIIKLVILIHIIFFHINYIYILCSNIININNIKENITYHKNHNLDLINLSHIYGFNQKLYKTGDFKISDKVDIIIANHINISDFIMISVLLKKICNKNIHFVLSRQIIFKICYSGLLMHLSDDFFINRNFDKDILIIENTINNINNGIILIYPEGNMLNEKSYKESITFCKENNLKQFNNLLYPKAKGLWNIINILKKQNKLGNLIDLTIILDKLKEKQKMCPSYLLSTKPFKSEEYDIGNIYHIIKTYNLNKYIDNYDIFKNFLINIWRKKDKLLEGQNYKKLNYQEIKYEKNQIIKTLLFALIKICIFIYLIIKTKGIIIPASILLLAYHYKQILDYYKKYD